jgi:hypothetical protein
VGTYSGSGIGLSSGGDGLSIFSPDGFLTTAVNFPAATAGSSFFWYWSWEGSLMDSYHINGLGLVSEVGEINQQLIYTNQNANTNVASPGTCIFPSAPNFGCMDATACNFDSLANYESGQCTYPNLYFRDFDGDGFGNDSDTVLTCVIPLGYANNGWDCLDSAYTVNPNASESCITQIDDNCDGLINIGCPAFKVSIKSENSFVSLEENTGWHYIPIQVDNGVLDSVQLTLVQSIYSDASPLEDYVSADTVWIPAAYQGEFLIPVLIVDDTLNEFSEKVIYKISTLSQGVIDTINYYQILFIKDNDTPAIEPSNQLQLQLLSSYANGASGFNSAEIVAYDDSTQRLYIVNSVAARLDIVDFSVPENPIGLNTMDLSSYGGINSVAIDQGRIAVAMEALNPQDSGFVLLVNSLGDIVQQIQVGAMPDMICFSPDHQKLMTANEGEPNADYSADPLGSISIIDVSGDWSLVTQEDATTLNFSDWNDSLSVLLERGVRIFGTNATVAMDLEPEYIAVSSNSEKAYVTLQENNGMVVVDLVDLEVEDIRSLGGISYMEGNNAMDASDLSNDVLITSQLPIRSTFMPDAISYAQILNQGYLFTANEGDSREFGDIVDANRIGSDVFTLDSVAFPDADILKHKKFLGRLNALKYSGDNDSDGDYDELHVLGGRSFSIWDATSGALVFDSKYLLEKITSESGISGDFFNASNALSEPVKKNRSDDKGPEPEGIVVKRIDDRHYAFVALERVGGVVVFDVTNPANPNFVTYANNRQSGIVGPDLGAEGILFIADTVSPNGKNLILLANEVSSTVSVFQINTCSDLTPYQLISPTTQACQGDSIQLSISSLIDYTVYWTGQDSSLLSQDSIVWINTSGSYHAVITNLEQLCTIQSDNVSVQFNANFSQFQDVDQDGYGWELSEIHSCDTIFGYVFIAGDCDDSSFFISPNAIEICNEIDDNCNAIVDEGLTIFAFEDFDSDGFGNPDIEGVFCVIPAGFVENNWDCNDTLLTYWDFDNDGYGVDSVIACGVTWLGDCNDSLFEVNPGAMEIADNNLDENCDGLILTHVQEFLSSSTLVYPNPTSGVLRCSDNDRFKQIFDSSGRLIQTFEVSVDVLDLFSLEDGYYWVVMESGRKQPVLKVR